MPTDRGFFSVSHVCLQYVIPPTSTLEVDVWYIRQIRITLALVFLEIIPFKCLGFLENKSPLFKPCPLCCVFEFLYRLLEHNLQQSIKQLPFICVEDVNNLSVY